MDFSPLSILLVKNDSKGDKLLFRYPIPDDENKNSLAIDPDNPYVIFGQDHSFENVPRFVSHIKNDNLTGFDDRILCPLCAVKRDVLCGKRLEVKVNDVRFVGHPFCHTSFTSKDNVTSFFFNLIFVLKASASLSIVDVYHDLSHRLGLVLEHEENASQYFSEEAKKMLTVLDEMSASIEEGKHSPYHEILKKSNLAEDLSSVYKNLYDSGEVHIRINGWNHFSFCLPHKVHFLHNEELLIEPQALYDTLRELRPYHGMLLLVEEAQLLESLPLDYSTALTRLLKVYCPSKNFQTLSADSDLTLLQVFQLSCHLVYWCRATVIYPLCENNFYILSPGTLPTHFSENTKKFEKKFPGYNLITLMSEFSLPCSIAQKFDPTVSSDQKFHYIQMILWMLKHRILVQLHTYVYLCVPNSTSCSHQLENYSNNLSEDCSSPSSQSLLLDLQSSITELNEIETRDGNPVASVNDQSREQDTWAGLQPEEIRAIKGVEAATNPDDLKLFLKLCPYFRGQHHLEEIMYIKNLRRSQLNTVLDKFRDILLTCDHEDERLSSLIRGSNE